VAVTYFGVNAFSRVPFGGNPAVVCLLDPRMGDDLEGGLDRGSGRLPLAPDDGWMQRIGAEFNQPATAFLWRGERGYELRWFTATTELPLCGHGSLATAHVLYETGRAGADEVVALHARADTVTVRRADGRIWLDLPGPALVEHPSPAALLAALGLTGAEAAGVEWVGHNDFDGVVRLADPALVARVRPDFAALRALPVRRTAVTAEGGAGVGVGVGAGTRVGAGTEGGAGVGVDFTSRVFGPALGVDEDHATGAAHAVLGRLWAGWLGRTELTARQASPRGAELAMQVTPDTVRIGGHAVTTTRGELLA